MIPLATRLDDLDFDGLLAIARRRLPGLAPEWTDYNYHDPGITLVELLAWVADSQIYSLARNRRDERLAMAQLLGVTPEGATPATGIVYPLSTPLGPEVIERDTVLKPVSASAPRIETTAKVVLLPVEIRRLATRNPDGTILDLTATNQRQRASFVPFGDEGSGELWIELRQTAAAASDGELLLSLGVELDGDPRDRRPPLPHLGAIEVEDQDGNPLPLAHDSSHGLQRSGVWIISLRPEQLGKRIVVRRSSGYPLRPRIVQIWPNALPVEQRATIKVTKTLLRDGKGREISLVPALAFGDDEPLDDRTWRLASGESPLSIDVERDGKFERWHAGRLDDSEPDDLRYSIDEQPDGSGIRLRFGNGVNGRTPGLTDTIKLSVRLSTGSDGNVRKPVEWLIEAQRLRFHNTFPISGGRDAENVGQALHRASARLRDKRVLASPKQLLDALQPLRNPLEIARAEVEEGWEEGRRIPSVAATRTLIVAHERPGGETSEWLRAIKRYLARRIAVGERLIVKQPEYVRFGISVVVDPAAGSDRTTLEKAIREELNLRFVKRRDWPLGRDVDASAISGWVRAIEGVAGVRDLKLLVNGREQDHLEIGRGALPQLDEPVEVKLSEPPR